jgi:hypothetical protein
MAAYRWHYVCAVDDENRYIQIAKGLKYRRKTLKCSIGSFAESGTQVSIEVTEWDIINLLRQLNIGNGEYYFDRAFDDTLLAELVMSAPVAALEFSIRTRSCLGKLGINTIAQLVEKTPEELFSISNFGRKSLAEINDKLDRIGLALKEGKRPVRNK